jgi:4-nitrophenyl phosphatase
MEASLHIRNGAPFYATNDDKTYPTPMGQEPGAGAILAAIEAATGVEPIVAGKPNTTVIEYALELLGITKDQALMVGDRLETDILAGQLTRIRTALVLSGASTELDVDAWIPKPDLIAENLSHLLGMSNH